MSILNRIISKVKYKLAVSNSDRYITYLRNKGIRIGWGTKFKEPKCTQIDITRPELIEIGEHCFLHKGLILMTHDWASWCFVHTHKEFIPSHGKIKIGNNVWFGENVTVCKGVTIGDNCIIGIGSVVTKSIPSNSVAAGIPCKVIGSYEDYFEKRNRIYTQEALEYAREILRTGREPVVEDFYDDYPCFVDGSNYQNYNYPYRRIFKTDEEFAYWLENHHKVFNGFDDFIKHVKENE